MSLRDAIRLLAVEPRPFSIHELLSVASRHGLEGAVRRGQIVRVLPSLYAGSLHADSWIVRARSALEWAPDAVLSGTSALFACGALVDPPTRIELLVPRSGRRRYPAWISPRRSDLNLPDVPWLNGHRMLHPACAVALGYGIQHPDRRADIVYGPVRTRCVTPEDIVSAVSSLPRVRDRRGVLRRAAMESAGVESFLEERGARDVLVGPEFAGLVRQHRLTVGRMSSRVDAFHGPTLTAFEFDGERFHEPRRLADRRRDAVLASVGVLTVRFGFADVMNRPDWCREAARGAIAARVPLDPLRAA